MKNSEVIIQKNTNKHISHLVKAVQSLEGLTEYQYKPKGVWGSVAKIVCGNVTIDSSNLDLEFSVPFDDNLEANEGEIIVYNLLDNTIKQLKKGASLSITAGYEGDTGLIFKGYITKVKTHREGADKVTVIKVIDDIGEKKSIKDETFDNAMSANKIMDKLIAKTNLPIGKVKYARNHTYDSTQTFDGTLEAALKQYGEVCGVSVFTSNGKIYACKVSEVSENSGSFNITEDTGMIGSPSPFEETNTINVGDDEYVDTLEGYELDMLLQHRMCVGAKCYLKSEQYSGTYYVKSGSHTFNGDECITHIKIVGG